MSETPKRPSTRSKIDENQLLAFEAACKNRVANWHKPFVIYGLLDPITTEIRYIGKTERPCERLSAHWSEKSNCHRSHWIQNLIKSGHYPSMIFLEMIEGEGDAQWEFYEMQWIAKAKEYGWKLTNNTSGGDGVKNLPPETLEKIRQASIGRKPTPEQKAKAVAARAHYRPTPETKAKQSASMIGRKIEWIDKISDKLRKLNDDEQSEIIQRRINGEKVKDLALAYNVHRTTISKIFTGTYNKLRQNYAT